MEVIITSDYDAMSVKAAELISELIVRKPEAVLGLATGSTPVGTYQELARLYQDGLVDFSQVTTFNLDEYVGLDPEHNQSYHYFMHDQFFQHVNCAPDSINIPWGTSDDHDAFCTEYEQKIVDSGGIDLQLLGIGGDGHIAFNEPGSSLGSRTRMKTLTQQTVEDNRRFFDDTEEVPSHAITMGVGTIMEARHCLMLASGEGKAETIASALEGPVTSMITASALQLHQQVTVILDEAAASQLSLHEYYDWVYQNKPE